MIQQSGDTGTNRTAHDTTAANESREPDMADKPSAAGAARSAFENPEEPSIQDRVNAIRELQQDRARKLIQPFGPADRESEPGDATAGQSNASDTSMAEEPEGTYAATAGDIALTGSTSDRDLGLVDDGDLDASERGMLENVEEEHLAHEIHEQRQRLLREIADEPS